MFHKRLAPLMSGKLENYMLWQEEIMALFLHRSNMTWLRFYGKKMLLKHLLESSPEIIQGFRKHHHIKLLKSPLSPPSLTYQLINRCKNSKWNFNSLRCDIVDLACVQQSTQHFDLLSYTDTFDHPTSHLQLFYLHLNDLQKYVTFIILITASNSPDRLKT